MPERGHRTDAGLDLKSRETKIVPARGSANFDTGIHIEIPEGYCGILISKSGLNTRKNIQTTGLIDSGYTGSIVVPMKNLDNKSYKVKAGDKISQLVLVPCLLFEPNYVEEFKKTERGDKGFGSTGK